MVLYMLFTANMGETPNGFGSPDIARPMRASKLAKLSPVFSNASNVFG